MRKGGRREFRVGKLGHDPKGSGEPGLRLWMIAGLEPDSDPAIPEAAKRFTEATADPYQDDQCRRCPCPSSPGNARMLWS